MLARGGVAAGPLPLPSKIDPVHAPRSRRERVRAEVRGASSRSAEALTGVCPGSADLAAEAQDPKRRARPSRSRRCAQRPPIPTPPRRPRAPIDGSSPPGLAASAGAALVAFAMLGGGASPDRHAGRPRCCPRRKLRVDAHDERATEVELGEHKVAGVAQSPPQHRVEVPAESVASSWMTARDRCSSFAVSSARPRRSCSRCPPDRAARRSAPVSVSSTARPKRWTLAGSADHNALFGPTASPSRAGSRPPARCTSEPHRTTDRPRRSTSTCTGSKPTSRRSPAPAAGRSGLVR